MFYHASIGVTGITSWLERNKTRDDVLRQIVCPYINREITFWDGRLYNMTSFGYITVIATDKPVDSDWPLKKSDYIKEGKSEPNYTYNWDVQTELAKLGKDVTEELYREAVLFIEGGKYRELRRTLTEEEKGRMAFFICPFDNEEVNHNYEYVIKPSVERHQFQIQRADEITHTRTITDAIMSAINQSRFLIADLTTERPNCYYEVGYAHAIGKPVVILAKDGTPRHFDLAAHKWTYWSDYKDLKTKLDKELQGVLSEIAARARKE